MPDWKLRAQISLTRETSAENNQSTGDSMEIDAQQLRVGVYIQTNGQYFFSMPKTWNGDEATFEFDATPNVADWASTKSPPSDSFVHAGYYVTSHKDFLDFKVEVRDFTIQFVWQLFKLESFLKDFPLPHRYIPRVTKFVNKKRVYTFVGRTLKEDFVLESNGTQVTVAEQEFREKYTIVPSDFQFNSIDAREPDNMLLLEITHQQPVTCWEYFESGKAIQADFDDRDFQFFYNESISSMSSRAVHLSEQILRSQQQSAERNSGSTHTNNHKSNKGKHQGSRHIDQDGQGNNQVHNEGINRPHQPHQLYRIPASSIATIADDRKNLLARMKEKLQKQTIQGIPIISVLCALANRGGVHYPVAITGNPSLSSIYLSLNLCISKRRCRA